MKTRKLIKIAIPLLVYAMVLCSCNNNQLVQQYKTLHQHDSLLMAQTIADDSTIKGYIQNLNAIQNNIDEIKRREKILSLQGSEAGNGNSTVADVKMLDSLIISSNKQITSLHVRVKNLYKRNSEMESMVARMTTQIAQQDTEIGVLQGNLARINDSYKQITEQFNDSIVELQNQNARIEVMANNINTVYYAIGTMKELKDNNVIDKTGGFIAIGRNSQVKPDFNITYFTKTDLTQLQVIPLNAKFKKLISNHPTDSYKITGDGMADSLWITNEVSFWRENKYLVIAVK